MTNKHPCEWYIQMAEMYKKKYDDLVFKIHEKIEQIHPNESFESWKKNTLKSLLENSK